MFVAKTKKQRDKLYERSERALRSLIVNAQGPDTTATPTNVTNVVNFENALRSIASVKKNWDDWFGQSLQVKVLKAKKKQTK